MNLTNLSTVPKTSKNLPEFTSLHMLGTWFAMIAFFAILMMTGCDASVSQSVAPLDTTHTATKTPYEQIIGAWKSVRQNDSLSGIAFLPSGRFIRSSEACGGVIETTCAPSFDGGRWSIQSGSLVLSTDSSGSRNDPTSTPSEYDRCDSLICWYEDIRPTTVAASYGLRGDTLIISSSTYARVIR